MKNYITKAVSENNPKIILDEWGITKEQVFQEKCFNPNDRCCGFRSDARLSNGHIIALPENRCDGLLCVECPFNIIKQPQTLMQFFGIEDEKPEKPVISEKGYRHAVKVIEMFCAQYDDCVGCPVCDECFICEVKDAE